MTAATAVTAPTRHHGIRKRSTEEASVTMTPVPTITGVITSTVQITVSAGITLAMRRASE